MDKRKIKINTQISLADAEIIKNILWQIWADLADKPGTNAEIFDRQYKVNEYTSYSASQIFGTYRAMGKRVRKLDKKYDFARMKELKIA